MKWLFFLNIGKFLIYYRILYYGITRNNTFATQKKGVIYFEQSNAKSYFHINGFGCFFFELVYQGGAHECRV